MQGQGPQPPVSRADPPEPAPPLCPRLEPSADLDRVGGVDEHGIEAEAAELAEQRSETALVRTRALACRTPADPDVGNTAAERIGERKHDVADRWERLLPYGV